MRKSKLANCPQWLLDADTENEDVIFDDYGTLQWRSGNFRGGNFLGGNFLGGNFWGGDFRGGNFRGGNFWGGDFRGGNFRGGDFWGGDFRGGNFLGGNFCGGNFWGGDFRGGDFRGGDFWGEKLSKKPQTLYGHEWVIYITKEQMQIGCQRHTHAQWEAFEHKDIKGMSSKAVDLWVTWRTPLLMMCMQHRKN